MRSFLIISFFVASLPCWAQRPPGRQDPPPAIRALDRMLQEHQLKFSGVRTVEQIIDGERKRLVEYVLREGSSIRITYPEDSPLKGFVIIERQGQRLEYNPHQNVIFRKRSERAKVVERINQIKRAAHEGRLRLTLFESGQVSSRRTVGVQIADLQGNLAQRYWMDADSGLILKAVQYGRGGAEIASFEYTRISFDPIIKQGDFELNVAGAKIVDVREDGLVGLAPTWLPDGFQEVERNVRQLQGREVTVVHYSNGVQHLTAFVAAGGRPMPPPPPDNRRRLNTVGRRINESWVVLVSELDTPILERVLNSYRSR